MKNEVREENEDDAEDVAFAYMEDKHEKAFFNVYKDFLVKSLYTRKSRLHQKVLGHAVELHKMDVPAKDAVKMSVRKHKHDFDAPSFVKHAATVNDSEDESDEENQSSETSDNSVEENGDTNSSHSGTSSESEKESNSSCSGPDTESSSESTT